MKALVFTFVFLFLSTAHAEDNLVEMWKRCPAGAPLPTLDHHLFHGTIAIAGYGVLRIADVHPTTAAYITSAFGIGFELVQVLFFNEHPLHALRDTGLFQFHLIPHFFTTNEPHAGVFTSAALPLMYVGISFSF